MNRLPFEYWQEGAIHWARFVTTDQSPVHEHWWGLWDTNALESIGYAHFKQFSVNGNNSEEVAVYTRVLWALLREQIVVATARQYGHGKNSVSDARDKSWLSRIASFQDLTVHLQSVLRGKTAQITLVGTTSGSVDKLKQVLAADDVPSISEVLQYAELLVVLGVGVDDGQHDYILIAGTQTLEPLLAPIVRSAERAICAYEDQLTDDTTPADFLKLLQSLAGQ